MSGSGNCYDNAIMETFFHTLKKELVYFEHYETRNEARGSIFEYIEVFYNREQRHAALNYKFSFLVLFFSRETFLNTQPERNGNDF
jgi:putative transposase